MRCFLWLLLVSMLQWHGGQGAEGVVPLMPLPWQRRRRQLSTAAPNRVFCVPAADRTRTTILFSLVPACLTACLLQVVVSDVGPTIPGISAATLPRFLLDLARAVAGALCA